MSDKVKTAIAHGNTADIYVYDNKVIKLFKSHFPREIATYERDKLMFVYQKGLPVPKPLSVDQIDGKDALVMAFIKGYTLGQLIESDQNQLDHYLALSIDVQQKMHQVDAEGLERMTDKLVRQIKAAELLTAAEKKELCVLLANQPMVSKLCHGDFHCYNLIQSKTDITIIDWLDASAGHPLADVCRTYLLYSGFSSQIAEKYLTLYLEKSTCARVDALAWLPIIAGARLEEHLPEQEKDRLAMIVRTHL
ncbi:aminoglycoside phosphotransferase family protein [Amphibacillus jilinensis]|uniref:aminoglycoside phosphotransferase family protein n=1 Tax=Amphibacillus jilinensis TaxID=1216008 RepID=UPI000315F0A0|nr:aminoglycoside phosphotransferase family protein [Amphibacillus jilinensis]